MRLITRGIKNAVRKKRDREGSTQALVQAALEVFSSVGYDAATTREVAKKAGVSEALIQRYFEGKAGLLVAVMEVFAAKEMETTLAALPYQATLREEILQLISMSCDQMKTHSDFLRVALSRAIVDPKVGKQLASVVHGRRLPAIVARLGSYREKGQIHTGTDLNALAFGISSLAFSVGFMAPNVFGFEGPILKSYAEYFSALLASGAAAPPAK
ncbi:TetR/AcrR family transcriptional regulator [bacterium]|nr:TetR/AcrR family transcriptional regulator [bacterium]